MITFRIVVIWYLFFGYLVKMLNCPADEGGDMRHEASTAFGQRIFHTRRHFGIDLTRQQAYLLQPLERLRQHLLRAVRHVTVQVVGYRTLDREDWVD